MLLALIYLPILGAISWFYKDHSKSTLIHGINLFLFLIPLAFNDEGAVFCLLFGSFWIAWGMSWSLKHGKTFFLTGLVICIVGFIVMSVLAYHDVKGKRFAIFSIYGLIGVILPPLFALFSIFFRLGEYTGNKRKQA